MSDPAPFEVPIWPALIVPVLQELEAGPMTNRKALFEAAADRANLSSTAREERLTSGGTRYEQRMGWVLSNSVRANLIERTGRGRYALTEQGRNWLGEHPNGLTYSQARLFFRPFWPRIVASDHSGPEDVEEVPPLEPVEQIEDGVQRIRQDVGSRLLERLRDSHPDFFEKAVIDLLLAMGYGGVEQRGRRVGGTGDGGIDGVIDEDALGLDRVYIQAKRYAQDSNIGRETIQAFVGALAGLGATKGVFITTSNFTSSARSYAENVSARIVLIDSSRLSSLMIKYKVGVQVRETYEVVDLDEDFFES